MYIRLLDENVIISSNYGICNYMMAAKDYNVMAATSSQQQQAAVNFDVSRHGNTS